jgi:hypothetical protein
MLLEETAMLSLLSFMVTVTTELKREVVKWATLGSLSVADMVYGK